MELKDLKVGDKVFVGTWRGNSLEVVEKITPKGFIKVGGILYDPKDGWARGGDPWGGSHLVIATQEAIEEYNKQRFTRAVLRKMENITELTYEQATAIYKILWEDDE